MTPAMITPLTAEEFEALRRWDTCTLANAIETFRVRLRNEGFADGSIRCQFPDLPPILGYAATVTIRGSAPPTAGRLYLDRTDWWDYVVSVPSPRMVVVQDVATLPGLGSLLGAVHINILRALGCVGAVTNGAVRDVPAAEEIGFQLFAVGITPSHGYVHIIEYGKPVEAGGLKINSGDLVHGDRHGVQSIPLDIATRVPAAAEAIAAKEKRLIALCQSPDFTVGKLRDAVAEDRS